MKLGLLAGLGQMPAVRGYRLFRLAQGVRTGKDEKDRDLKKGRYLALAKGLIEHIAGQTGLALDESSIRKISMDLFVRMSTFQVALFDPQTGNPAITFTIPRRVGRFGGPAYIRQAIYEDSVRRV
jgi:hypothetical protein